MNATANLIKPRRLRAPQEDGATLVDPALPDAADEVARNIEMRALWDVDLQGMPLGQLAQLAHQDVLTLAQRYTAQYRNLDAQPSPDLATPIIMVGHQPELVHAGVWFKNFVMTALANQVNGRAIHLICDNDHVRQTALQVPTGTPAAPRVVTIPFDENDSAVAYEHRPVRNQELFRSFAQRVAQQLAPLVPDPLIRSWWPLAIQALDTGAPLGAVVARARHQLEGQWGVDSLEVPLGQLCGQPPFQFLAAYLLGQADAFLDTHNDCLTVYRRVNRVRSHSHPVPNLQRDDDWYEVPFWLWTRSDPVRRPAWARNASGTTELSDRHAVSVVLPRDPEQPLDGVVEHLAAAEQRGVFLRPRALMTTMFARLLLSDIFVHGIGGAKYDELTDALICRVFGIAPPAFVVATMTAQLPIAKPDVQAADLRRIDSLLRELRYHPERHVDLTSRTKPLVRAKHDLLTDRPANLSARDVHYRLEAINQQLTTCLHSRQAQLREQRLQLQATLRATAILQARDYAFCLFPEHELQLRLLDIVR